MPSKSTEMSVGKRIQAARLKRGFSQSAVSRRAGMAPSYLSRIESSKVHPTVRMAMRIATVLRISLDDLVGPRPPETSGKPCPVSASGQCLLDLINTPSYSEGQNPSGEHLSPRQLRVARSFTMLVLGAAASN